MNILYWDKPKPTMTTEEWKASYGFEDGPSGGYVPNMSSEDMDKWKAKLLGHTTDHPQIEIRKSFAMVQMLFIVSLGNGYNYKGCKHNAVKGDWRSGQYTKGVNVHVAMNGGAQLTFEDINDLHAAVQEAKMVLEGLKKV